MFLLTTLFLSTITSSLLWCSQPQDELPFSKEDIHKLEEAAKEVDEFVNTLPPEQQQAFNDEVAALTKEMEKMSEDELLEFIGNVLEMEELQDDEQDEQPVQPAKQKQEIQQKVTHKEKVTKAMTSVLDLMTELAKNIANVLNKIQSIPDFTSQVETWAKQGKMSKWQTRLTWNKLKEEIENLQTKLYKANDKDTKTKEYKYLKDLSENITLKNNLEQLNNVLKKHEPKVKTPDFGLKALTDTSKNALQEIASSLSEAVYELEIPQALEKIFTKYEPKAAQLKKEAEKKDKAAFDASKKTPRQERAKIAGRKDQSVRRGAGSDVYSDYSVGDYDYPYTSYTPARRSSGSTLSPTSYAPARSGSASSAPSGKAGAPGSKPEKADTKKDKKTENKKPAGRHKDDLSQKRLDKVESQLDKAMETLEENSGILINIENHITSAQPVNIDVAGNTLRKAIKQINKAIDLAEAFHRATKNVVNPAIKKSYYDDLQGLQDQHARVIDSVINQIDNIKRVEDTHQITTDKKYAYLGGKDRSIASDGVKDQVPYPSSLYDLRTALSNLKRELEKRK